MDKNKFDNLDEQKMDNLDEKQMEKIADFYLEFTKTKIPWIQRKEISSWSAIVFYYAIIWSLGNFLINLRSEYSMKIPDIYFVIFLISMFFLAWFFLVFIYVQYQEIYQMTAASTTARKIIQDIAFEKKRFFSEHRIESSDDLAKYFEDKKKKNKKKFHKFNKRRPIKIFFCYWIVPFQKLFHSKNIMMKNKELEEASLYYLIIAGPIFYIIAVLYNFGLIDKIYKYFAHIL